MIDLQETELIRQMIDRVNTTIVVADHSKVGRVSFSSVAPLDRVDILITDSKADEEVLNAIRKKGINVRVV